MVLVTVCAPVRNCALETPTLPRLYPGRVQRSTSLAERPDASRAAPTLRPSGAVDAGRRRGHASWPNA
eukprot:scaffold2349_cov407-Prasinococcus_capsulatus_cf.AAC.2